MGLEELFGMTRICTRVSSKMALHAGMADRSTQMEASMRDNGKTLFGTARENIFELTVRSVRESLNTANLLVEQ